SESAAIKSVFEPDGTPGGSENAPDATDRIKIRNFQAMLRYWGMACLSKASVLPGPGVFSFAIWPPHPKCALPLPQGDFQTARQLVVLWFQQTVLGVP
ncbi:hypothetical protein, partial [Erythrobacter sanguineus]|uniref:hypothetical protein n=1 Tax=Erythrobacter sanguineus TaxID=198312 RepID=UPI001B80ADF1